jgi:small-conductance mechanosensitive channel
MQEQITRLLQQYHLHPYVWNIILISAAIILGLLIKFFLFLVYKLKPKNKTEYSIFYSVVTNLGLPINFFLPLVLFNFFLPFLRLDPPMMKIFTRATEILLIIGFSWILLRTINVVQDYVYFRFDIKKQNNIRERKIRTQLQFIRQLVKGLIILLTIAAVLLTFSAMRKIGTGLLTGVGIGGIIIGFAAQSSLRNLLAGFQIAFTQPIRIDDAVLVENEFGYIEEITLTYVVVRIWDDRRMVLPIFYFIEKPFQNWTRSSTAMLGTAMFYVDYRMPLDPLRKELARILNNNPTWDKRVGVIQVTNITDKTVELRVLVSASNSGTLFELRCFVRENLLRFINENYPEHLPKTRAFLEEKEIRSPDVDEKELVKG